MDSYETLNSKSKYDANKKFGSLTGLGSDSNTLDKDEIQSMKPLKFYTENFFDKNIIQNRGINFNDGFGVPSCQIDQATISRYGALTKLNIPQNLPSLPLPTTASYVHGQGPVEIEDSIRPKSEKDLKTCQPTDQHFYDRSFYIFDGLPIKPNDCVDNVAQRDYRQGVSTRNVCNKTYRSVKRN